jgi:hypothetical protein
MTNPFPNKIEVQRDQGGWPELTCLGIGLVGQVVRFEDAQFIATACNSHDDMLAALRRAVLALAFAAESSPTMRDDYNAVSAAISKATGAPA